MTDTKARLALLLRDFVETNGRAPTAHERHDLAHQAEISSDAERYDPPAPGSPAPEPPKKSLLEILTGL
jgi:hypothetical protein